MVKLSDLRGEAREEELARQRAVARRRQGVKPPYKEIDRALAWAREQWPNAAKYVPGWYGGAVYVEVWTETGAKVRFYPG